MVGFEDTLGVLYYGLLGCLMVVCCDVYWWLMCGGCLMMGDGSGVVYNG